MKTDQLGWMLFSKQMKTSLSDMNHMVSWTSHDQIKTPEAFNAKTIFILNHVNEKVDPTEYNCLVVEGLGRRLVHSIQV